MVAIAMIRGISAGVVGTENPTWNSFWVQLEASISVIAACPAAFRSLFLVNKSSKENLERDNQGQRSALARLWKRTKPSLQSIRVGATLTGIRTVIRDNGNTELGSKDDEEYALSSLPVRDPNPSFRLDAPERSVETMHQPVQAVQTMV